MRGLWQKWQEQIVIAALVAACLTLAFLQYRWTGELSQAMAQRLLGNARARLQQFTRAFDTELRESVTALIPSSEEIGNLGIQGANEERLRSMVTLERPIFKRVAAAIRTEGGALQYWEADSEGQHFAENTWPAAKAWSDLRANLESISRGEGRPRDLATADSTLIEVPVFAAERESEWLLFELDPDYVTKTWLPELVRTYLDIEGDSTFHVGIRWKSDPSRWIYGEHPTDVSIIPDAEASIFPPRLMGGRGNGGRGKNGKGGNDRGDDGKGGGKGGDGRNGDGRWLVTLGHAQGSLPATVATARARNLAVAFILLMLIAAAAAALLRNTRQAQRLAAAQYQFFAGISHELRTPLTVIQGAGHNLLSGVVRDEAQRESYIRAIVKQSSQLNEMVDQVLSYGSARNAPMSTDVSSVSLDVVVSEAIELAAIELEQSGRSVDVDMPPDLLPVRGSYEILRRVLGNLILNAVRHGGGEVKISASANGPVVVVQVSDSGNGIPPEELKQIFDPFFRGAHARTGRARGTGLGLSLVKEEVEKLGGSVLVESSLGKGTTFTVRLPVAS